MHWRRREKEACPLYKRLVDPDDRAVKGCVPLIVGSSSITERFEVPIGLLKDPCIVSLLEIGAQEFGYRQKGILRIPCDSEHFRRVIAVINKSR